MDKKCVIFCQLIPRKTAFRQSCFGMIIVFLILILKQIFHITGKHSDNNFWIPLELKTAHILKCWRECKNDFCGSKFKSLEKIQHTESYFCMTTFKFNQNKENSSVQNKILRGNCSSVETI